MAKKDFKSNPSLQFISGTEKDLEQSLDQPANRVPEGYRINPAYIEKRDQRINILITRSTREALKAISSKTGRSVNDIINEALDAYMKE